MISLLTNGILISLFMKRSTIFYTSSTHIEALVVLEYRVFFLFLAAYRSFEREIIRQSLGRPGTRWGYRITTSTKSLKQLVTRNRSNVEKRCFAFTTLPRDTQKPQAWELTIPRLAHSHPDHRSVSAKYSFVLIRSTQITYWLIRQYVSDILQA